MQRDSTVQCVTYANFSVVCEFDCVYNIFLNCSLIFYSLWMSFLSFRKYSVFLQWLYDMLYILIFYEFSKFRWG